MPSFLSVGVQPTPTDLPCQEVNSTIFRSFFCAIFHLTFSQKSVILILSNEEQKER